MASVKVTAQKPILTVLTYNSFAAEWGPGPLLKSEFEKSCDCELKILEVADSGLMLQRLDLDGDKAAIDMVIGFDQFDLAKAQNKLKWREISLPPINWHPEVLQATKLKVFVPFDWGYLAFNTRKNELEFTPTSLQDLLNPNLKGKIGLMDPRTSSPGMQLLSWVMTAMGTEKGETFLRELSPQVHSYANSWSLAYGLFQKKQVSLVFSYVTSPIYHLLEEKKENFISLEFQEGHPMQVEFFAIPDVCRNCDLAENFANFLLSETAQKIIMSKNFMLPVVQGYTAGTPFENIAPYRKLKSFDIPSEDQQKIWVDLWSRSRFQ